MMTIFIARIFMILMLSFSSFRHCRSSASSTRGSRRAWRGWPKKRGIADVVRSRNRLEGIAHAILLRGGSSSSDKEEVGTRHQDEKHSTPLSLTVSGDEVRRESILTVPTLARKEHRCTRDVILDLLRRSSVEGKVTSIELRELIATRSAKFLEDLKVAVEDNDSKLPHPRKLLHYLAPKVPAIKHSPDVNLRIHSARSDIDSSIAACIIGSLAHVSEVYDKRMIERTRDKEETHSVAPELTTDRRFEQLVECVLNGVNIQKRKKESLTRQLEMSCDAVADIEQVLDEEDAHVDEGLNVRDACRAAWGISVLGCSYLDTLGDVKVLDLLLALSLRVRELLLARLQLIRQDDLFSDISDAQHISKSKRLNEVVEELAEDAAAAMWAFECVKACTGLQSAPLFETCCSILCQDPIDMRKRAQSADYEPGVQLGVHDVVDRLAEAEIVDQTPESENETNSNKTLHDASDGMEFGKYAFLDWLSPTEVNDVLWAIALHGSNNTSTSDEITLSETASALREIAFDRLLEWLEYDSELSTYADTGSSSHIVNNDEDEVTVEVVDAAALLASNLNSNESSHSTGDGIPVENISLSNHADVQEIEVVDAATLLASASDPSGEKIETETIAASSNMMEIDTNPEQQLSETLSSPTLLDSPEKIKTSRIFSSRDLAIMAWSVTELRDPLQVRIVNMVVRLFETLRLDGTTHLGGGDLANLAWAISKSSEKATDTEPDWPSDASNSVLSWIAHKSLERVLKWRSLNGEKFRRFGILESFQPPELGRLAWAIASTLSMHSRQSRMFKSDPEVTKLARLSLEAAALNSELFATEDLLRIAWAFLELCGDDDSRISLRVADALGSILTTVEQSLHQWERGMASASSHDGNDASVFSSFFGRTRLKHNLLEHTLNDGEDEDEIALAPIFEKSRKPLLRDLSVDPATLCKAACGYQRLSRKYPNMSGAWALTRVAIRLLASKNARLMKECSIHDVVRLCEATVLSQADGHGKDLVTGLFTRKVLQVLNDALDNGSEKSDSLIDVAHASPSEICTLLWSLGELGAKHYIHDNAKHLAYKRLHFVCETTLLPNGEIDSLEPSSLLKLLRGAVLMHFLATDKVFLLNILTAMKAKATKLGCQELCFLAESIALLKEGLNPLQLNTTSNNNSKETSCENLPSTEVEITHEQKEDKNVIEMECVEIEESRSQIQKGALIEEEIQHYCDAILSFVGTEAKKEATFFTTEEIRRLLTVYSLVPFRDDALVEALSSVVTLRKSHLEKSPRESLGGLLRTVRSNAKSVKDNAFVHTETESVFEQLKSGFMSFFTSIETEDNVSAKELLLRTSVQESIDRASTACTSAEDLQLALGISLDSIFANMKRGTAFELARCEELIENYHRINFNTGTFTSRYDKIRAKDIAKRVLSRLLP